MDGLGVQLFSDSTRLQELTRVRSRVPGANLHELLRFEVNPGGLWLVGGVLHHSYSALSEPPLM